MQECGHRDAPVIRYGEHLFHYLQSIHARYYIKGNFDTDMQIFHAATNISKMLVPNKIFI